MKLPKNLSKIGFTHSQKIKNSNELIDINSLTQVRKFIKNNFKKIKNINKKNSSYGLKHLVEHSLGVDVSNGELIAAMILEGYGYIEAGKNAYFNLSKKSINNLKNNN